MTTYLLLLAEVTSAAESLSDQLQVHGFISQAVLHTTENQWLGDSAHTSFAFTEIGVNSSLRLTPRLLFSGQILSRRAGELSNGTPTIDFALADFNLVSSTHNQVGIRAGRFKNPLGLYNETRDVPFTRSGIFLPQVIYFDKVRNLALSSDGLLFYNDFYLENGNISFSLGGGWPLVDTNVENAYLFRNFSGQLQADNPGWLASFWYSNQSERFKLGLSAMTVDMQFNPNVNALPFTTPGAGHVDLLYLVASVQYNTEQWSFTAEYSREPIEWRQFGQLFPDYKANAEGYYLQTTYRFHPQWEWLLRYEEGFANRADRHGNDLEQISHGFIKKEMGFSKIFSTGLRWNINSQWMLRAEYQLHNGCFILSPRENPDFSQLERNWSLFTLQIGFRF
ncbi:hypothetical protein HUK38_06590 [Thiospirillum jenense]|uniref:Porin n=2 Tax=Thiospirillum jenense TaxID=1653858 RepID=A0A839HF98_9GAMM|nr:hypothetical protein [Thiospirillum jenense]